VREQPLERRAREIALAEAELAGVARHEVLGEHRDVLLPLPERRDVDGDDAEPIQQILPESPRLHLFVHVPVGGRDDADVDALGLPTADGRDLAALQHPQELRLELHGHVPDLVEEERAPAGLAEAAQPCVHRAREGSAFVSEQLTLQ
jgi:hypothetical protein